MNEPTISDEMVEAFIALQSARIDGIERVRAGLAAVVPLIRAQVAAERRCVLCNPGSPEEIRQREEASAKLDRLILEHDSEPAITPAVPGPFAAPVTHREDFSEPDEPVADVQAAFEAGGKGVTGQPTALVTVDPSDLLTVLNQRTGHSHRRPGIWDPDNRPEIANKPCVECAARERLRAALSAATIEAYERYLTTTGRPKGAGHA